MRIELVDSAVSFDTDVAFEDSGTTHERSGTLVASFSVKSHRLNAFDRFDFGDDSFDGGFDALFERLHGVRTGTAMALEAYHNDPFVGHIDIFNIATVLL